MSKDEKLSEGSKIKRRKLKKGDLIVYPAYGVGKIEAIEKKDFDGKTISFYIIKILGNSMTVMVPKDKVDNIGLRDIISKEEIPNVYDFIKEKKVVSFDHQTWNRRYKEYMDKIKTGNIYEVAEVFRDLFLLKYSKELSFGERRLLDTSQGLLVKELAMAKGVDEENMFNELKSLFDNKKSKNS